MIGIPKGAKKVFKGIIFDVYQWEQKLYDGTKTTIEKLKRPNTAGVIGVTRDKKILLAFDEQPDREGVYATFGGRVEHGEDELVAAQREFLEESGCRSKDWELFSSSVPSNKIDWTVYTYIARNCEKVTEPKLDPGERITTKEVDFDEFVEIVTAEGFQDDLLANEVLRMIKEKRLEQFKERLLK